MNYWQAHQIVKEKLGDTKEICLQQFSLLQSYMQAMQLADPGGTYLLETETCEYLPPELNPEGCKQFFRLYVCWEATKNFWKHSRYYLCTYLDFQ